VLVTLAQAGAVARAQLPDTAFPVTIPVGQIPTGVAVNAAVFHQSRDANGG